MRLIKILLFGVIVIDFLGINMTLTLLPSLVMSPISTFVPLQWDTHTRLLIIGLLISVYPLGQFFGAAVWGKLSDNIGRKKALLLALIITALGFVIALLGITFHTWILFLIGRLVTGFSAGNVAIVLAYIADISNKADKSGNFSLMQTAIGLGLMLGASFGGVLSNSTIVHWFDLTTPFIVLTLVIMLNIILLYLILPNDSKKFAGKTNINPLQGLQQVGLFFKMQSHRMLLITWSLFIAGMTLFGLMFPTFLALKFNLSATKIGMLLTFWASVYTISQFFIVRPISKYFQSRFLLRLLMLLPGLIAISVMFYSDVYQLYVGIFFYAICLGFVMPNFFTILSNSVNSEHQGRLLGVATSIQGLMTVLMTLSSGILFSISYNSVALVGGGLMFTAWVVYLSSVKESDADSINLYI